MTMKITDALLGEHGALKAQFEYLEEAVERTQSLAEIQGIAGLLQAALATHAELENEILFPALRETPELGGPLSVMTEEHDEIEETLDRLWRVESHQDGQDLLRHTLQVAREHFAKEEEVLFPMAEQKLSPERLAELCRDWAGKRKVRVT